MFFSLAQLFAESGYNAKQALLSMSLEELLNVKVETGTLTGIESYKTPFSLTTIDSNHIRNTPARGLLDLMESYVPGATFTNHWLGPRIGLRGVMGDQNNSYLLLVNGLNFNHSANTGVTYEIQNKDLNDIEKVEFIRGPGSAVFGPGAIGGVMNIITKDAKTSPGLNLYLQGNEHYRYGILGASWGYSNKDFEAFVYGSISRSSGENDTDYFYIDRAHGYGYGYMGWDWGNKSLGTPAPNMFEDYWNNPEYKFHIELKWADEWIFRSRYTNFNYTALTQKGYTQDGIDSGGILGEMLSTSLENKHEFSDSLTLETVLSYISQSRRHVTFFQGRNEVSDHITQRQASYSENKASAKMTLNYNPTEQTRLAIGSEYSYHYYGPEWGMDDEDFILAFPAPLRFVVKTEDSGFHKAYGAGGFTSVITEQIDGSMMSLFGELQHDLGPDITLLFSARSDKHQYSNWVSSPRGALLWNMDEKNSFKLIMQKSVRLPNFTNLYAEHEINNSNAAPESVEGLEISYARSHNENLHFSATAYHNKIDQIAWYDDGTGLGGTNALVGVFKVAGLETEVMYQTDNDVFSFSYSMMEQIDWDPVETIDAWIVGLDGERIDLKDYGENRTNNFPGQQAKLSYTRHLPMDFQLHIDARMAWDYQQRSMLDSFSQAQTTYGNPVTLVEWNNIRNTLKDEGYAETSFTSNFSLSWNVSFDQFDCDVNFFVQNLVSVNHVRYVYQFWESGNTRQYARQAGFVKEPRTFGLRMQLKF